MPETVLRFTEAEKHRAAAAIHDIRHPQWPYNPVMDQWAYDYACAALAAAVSQEGTDTNG